MPDPGLWLQHFLQHRSYLLYYMAQRVSTIFYLYFLGFSSSRPLFSLPATLFYNSTILQYITDTPDPKLHSTMLPERLSAAVPGGRSV